MTIEPIVVEILTLIVAYKAAQQIKNEASA